MAERAHVYEATILANPRKVKGSHQKTTFPTLSSAHDKSGSVCCYLERNVNIVLSSLCKQISSWFLFERGERVELSSHRLMGNGWWLMVCSYDGTAKLFASSSVLFPYFFYSQYFFILSKLTFKQNIKKYWKMALKSSFL